MNHEQAINTLIGWLDSKNFFIEFEREGYDAVDLDNKIVSIKSTSSVETQLYTILHECGHILVRSNDKIIGYEDIYERYEESRSINKVFRVMEEVEAWKRGKILARRLCIPIDEEKWNRDMSRALKKYINWASEKNNGKK